MKKKPLLIAPSILSADFSHLAQEVYSVEKAHADLLHIDVMDGHFVPNITIGPGVVSDLKKRTKLPLDVHLMIKRPWLFVDDFVKAGASIITVHIETCSLSMIKKIKYKLKTHKVKLGVSINPPTAISKLMPVLKIADMILVMSVNPGFGGQKFIPAALKKIKSIRALYSGDIEVDGGITDQTVPQVVKNGANIIVAGSYIFGSKNRRQAIERLRRCKK